MVWLRSDDLPASVSPTASGIIWPNAQTQAPGGQAYGAKINPDTPSPPNVLAAALGGYSAMQFTPSAGTGSGSNLLVPLPLSTPGTTFSVFVLAAVNASGSQTGGPVVTDLAGQWSVGWRDGFQNVARVAGQNIGSPATPVQNQWQLYELLQSSGGVSTLLNWGNFISSAEINPALGLGPAAIQLGAVGSGATASLVAEFAVWDHVLSPADRQAAEGYFAQASQALCAMQEVI
jgi:hypothetical protein